jgi:hypothetical protein
MKKDYKVAIEIPFLLGDPLAAITITLPIVRLTGTTSSSTTMLSVTPLKRVVSKSLKSNGCYQCLSVSMVRTQL